MKKEMHQFALIAFLFLFVCSSSALKITDNAADVKESKTTNLTLPLPLSRSSEKSATTPPEKIELVFDENKLLEGILELSSSVQLLSNLKKELLYDSEGSLNSMNQLLLTQKRIADALFNYYGVFWKGRDGRKCVESFLMNEGILFNEISALHDFCTLRSNIQEDLQFLTNERFNYLLETLKSLLQICSDESAHLLVAGNALYSIQYQEALRCIVEPNLKVITELAETNYFEYIQQKTKLAVKELTLLLKKYSGYVETLKEDNFFALKIKTTSRFENISKQVEEVIRKSEENSSEVLQVELNMFKNAIQYIDKKGNMTYIAKALEDVFNLLLRMEENENVEKHLIPPQREVRKLMQNYIRVSEWIAFINDELPSFIIAPNLRKLQLFTGESTTFGKECEGSPSDLVGTCSAENYEICAIDPDRNASPESNHFTRNKNFRLDNRFLQKKCICGYRKDCITDKRITSTRGYSSCFLDSNSQGQCRGEVGYPCKTLPMGENKFDESCLSGKCNQKINECV